jgi:carbon monoxide dehydrogenase subunit G
MGKNQYLIFMPKIESRTGKVRASEEKVYTFLSNFNNFRKLIPEDKVKDWESTEDTCSFNVEGIGRFGLRIIEKEPNKLIKITSDDKTPVNFFLWTQIKEVETDDSRLRITVEVNVNPIMAALIKSPLQTFVDSLIDQAEKLTY